MMKSLFLFLLCSLSFLGHSQEIKKANRVTAEGKNISISYDQPSKNKREIFGGVVPYGKIWIVGGTLPAEMRFAKDGSFGGLPVKAGTYTLLAIPSDKEWTVILNAASSQGGSFNYQEVKDKDVLKVNVPARKISEVVETLNIRFSETQMILQWDQVQLTIPISF